MWHFYHVILDGRDESRCRWSPDLNSWRRSIVDSVLFPPWSMVFCHVDDVEKVVALLLREAGDKLDQEVRIFPILPIKFWWNSLIHHLWLLFLFFLQIKDVNIAAEVFRNYSFFEKVMETLLRKMGLMSEPDHLGPQASPKTQIAVTCEVRSGLVKYRNAWRCQ